MFVWRRPPGQRKDSVSISFDPSTGRVPATHSGIRSQDTSANEQNPAQARIFKPHPTPREKNKTKQKTKRKTFGFVVMYSDFLWRQVDVHQVSADVQDWMLASRRRSGSSLPSWEGVELTVSIYLYVCLSV